ncbi:MAG TPA: hypothetical protein VGO13_10960 [Solirubrobacterales bacterium]|nr:hypothetical protein [Solirubrobacterales bacterium]
MSSPRDDLRAFADLAQRPMTSWQARAFALVTAITVLVAGRGMGKSRSLASYAAWSAFTTANFRVLIVSASEASARRLLAEVRAVVGAAALRGSVVDEQAGLVRLSNGSEIRSVPSSERTIRGNVVDLLLVDEAAFVPDALLLGAAFPTTAARDGKIVLASSAGVAAGAFYDLAQSGLAGSEQVRTHRWVAKAAGGDCDASWITPSVIARERDALGSLRFNAEFLAQFASGADSLFSAAVLNRATADYEIPELADLRGPAKVAAGVDWGAVSDRSTLVAIGRLPVGTERIYGVRCAKRWRAGHPLNEVISEIVNSPALFDWLTAETNGLGAPCSQDLFRGILRRRPEHGGGRRRRVVSWSYEEELANARKPRKRFRERSPEPAFVTKKIALHVTSESKSATYSALRLLIDRGQLLLPASAEELRRELLMLKVTLGQTGNERIEASGGGHDDLADALAAALGPFKDRRDGKWKTRLGLMAASRRELPNLHAENHLAELTLTGSGLAIPARPVWASVAGPELSGDLDVTAPPQRLTPLQVRARVALTDALSNHDDNGGTK